MTERWLPVVGYEGSYEVSDLGRVRSLDRILPCGRRKKGIVLRPSPGANGGHLGLHLCAYSKRNARVHRLVLAAFVGPCPIGMEGCHDDGAPTNTRLRNLRWDTK